MKTVKKSKKMIPTPRKKQKKNITQKKKSRKSGGGVKKTFLHKIMDSNVSKYIESYTDAVYALHEKTPEWSIGLTHTATRDEGFLDVKHVGYSFLNDPNFIKLANEHFDSELKRYVWNNKLDTLPDDVYIDNVELRKRFDDIIFSVEYFFVMEMGKHREVTLRFCYDPDEKVFRRYYSGGDLLEPPAKLNSEDLEILKIDELIRKYHKPAVSNEESKKFREKNADLIARSDAVIVSHQNGFELTYAQKQDLADRLNLDDVTCPDDIEKFKKLIINTPLNRAITRKWMYSQDQKFLKYSSEEDEMLTDRDPDESLTQIIVQMDNCRIMKLIYMELKANGWDIEKLKHKILRDETHYFITDGTKDFRNDDYWSIYEKNVEIDHDDIGYF